MQIPCFAVARVHSPCTCSLLSSHESRQGPLSKRYWHAQPMQSSTAPRRPCLHVCYPTEWARLLAVTVEKCCKGLGVSAALHVEAQLYKLLLYEAGGHFVPHRDTEKVGP